MKPFHPRAVFGNRPGRKMKELFNTPEEAGNKFAGTRPLSSRMRPRSLDEFYGQKHILGEKGILRKIIEKDRIPSMILYGPPGCGKTAFAMLLSGHTNNYFQHLNAATATVSDVREVISAARHRIDSSGKRTILFLDEIAHFNKLQQDALMKDVEEGVIILVGATTHNPFFYINTPLLSRSRIFQFKPLSEEDLRELLLKAVTDHERGLGGMSLRITDEAIEYIVKSSEGDARRALNALELSATAGIEGIDGTVLIDLDVARETLQEKSLTYDRAGDQHYDTISAFIKSMRGSDPDAAVYWLAKMIASGEDPRFIARRILICASEDVGNADPQALIVAESCFRAVELLGMPEGRIVLAQAAIYVSTAPKSNSSYKAIDKALRDLEKEEPMRVPAHLQSTGYSGAGKLGKGEGYLYPHDFPGHYVFQEYMPSPRKYYIPSDSGQEKRISFFLNHIERLKRDSEKKNKKGLPQEKKGSQPG